MHPQNTPHKNFNHTKNEYVLGLTTHACRHTHKHNKTLSALHQHALIGRVCMLQINLDVGKYARNFVIASCSVDSSNARCVQ